MNFNLIKTSTEKKIDSFKTVGELLALEPVIREALSVSKEFRCTNCRTRIVPFKSLQSIAEEMSGLYGGKKIKIGDSEEIIDELMVVAENYSIIMDHLRELKRKGSFVRVINAWGTVKIFPLKNLCVECLTHQKKYRIERVLGESGFTELTFSSVEHVVRSVLSVGNSKKLEQLLDVLRKNGLEQLKLSDRIEDLSFETQRNLIAIAIGFVHPSGASFVRSETPKGRAAIIEPESYDVLIAPCRSVPSYFRNKKIGEALGLQKHIKEIYLRSPDVQKQGKLGNNVRWKGILYRDIQSTAIEILLETFSFFPKIKALDFFTDFFKGSKLSYGSLVSDITRHGQWILYAYYQLQTLKKGSKVVFDLIDDELSQELVANFWHPIIELYKKRTSVIVNTQ